MSSKNNIIISIPSYIALIQSLRKIKSSLVLYLFEYVLLFRDKKTTSFEKNLMNLDSDYMFSHFDSSHLYLIRKNLIRITT